MSTSRTTVPGVWAPKSRSRIRWAEASSNASRASRICARERRLLPAHGPAVPGAHAEPRRRRELGRLRGRDPALEVLHHQAHALLVRCRVEAEVSGGPARAQEAVAPFPRAERVDGHARAAAHLADPAPCGEDRPRSAFPLVRQTLTNRVPAKRGG